MFFYLIAVYILASVPLIFLIVKRLTGEDIRKKGNRKICASNVVRNIDLKAGLACSALSFLKGFLAVYLAQYFGFSLKVQVAAGILVVAAQLWPLFLRFWGGTGFVATIGALLLLSPKVALAAILVRIITESIINYFGLLPEGESMGISFSLLLIVVWGFLIQIEIGIFGAMVFILIHLGRLLGVPGSLKEIRSKKTLLSRLLYSQGVERG